MTKENGKTNWLYQIQEVNFTRDETPKEIPGTLKGLAVAHFRKKNQTDPEGRRNRMIEDNSAFLSSIFFSPSK